MASSSQGASRRTVVATAVLLTVLLILLALLAALNYLLRRPAGFEGDASGDRRFLFSIYGFEGNLFRRPNNVAFDDQGNIYVADTGKHRIVVFDPNGKFTGVYGTPGDGPMDLKQPLDVAVAPDGRSYVVQKSDSKMLIFDATRKPARVINFPDEPPLSVEINDDELLVTTASGVLIGNLDGDLQTSYIARGKESGQFDRPGGVAVGPDGTLFIADSLNYRVQAIGTDGKVKWTYGTPLPAGQAIRFSDPSRKFGLPASIAADESGFLYVVDGLNGEIQVLEQATGAFVEKIGDIGKQDGYFYYPDGIDYANGRLVIADKFNDRVQVFSAPSGSFVRDNLLPLAPWLLLPLLLLGLIPLLRRRTTVITPSFVESMLQDADGPEVAKALHKVAAVPDLYDLHMDSFEDLKWEQKEPKSEKVDDLMDKYELEQPYAEAIDILKRSLGRKVLLSDDEMVNEIAGRLGIGALTYEQVRASVIEESETETTEEDAS